MKNLFKRLSKNSEVDLYSFLETFRDSDVDFLPNWGNIGDMLIFASTQQILSDLNIRMKIVNNRDDCENDILFVSGGGNLIEAYFTMFSSLADLHDRYKLICILPHTIYNKRIFEIFVQSGAEWIILCRDLVSYNFLLSAASSKQKIFLCHDTAFYYNYRNWEKKGDGVLFAFRTDGERSKISIPATNLDISTEIKVDGYSLSYDYWNMNNWREFLEKFLEIISRHEEIHTNRLHVAIAGTMLSKRILFYPNSYFKNEAVYYYSLKKFKNINWLGRGSRIFYEYTKLKRKWRAYLER